jgi:cytochrome b6-f complex iron-sulfur subunit
MPRREFLSFGWKAGAVLAAAAGVWTSWDVLRPRVTSGLGGEVRTVPAEEVTQETALYIREAQAYLTRRDDDVVALWQRCPHLGCRVAWCESSGEFECACHGSTFNRLGEHRTGPSPSGMQEFAVTVVDGIVVVDTGAASDGAPLGTETIDEPRRGPSCTGEV